MIKIGLLISICVINAFTFAQNTIGENFEKGGFKVEGVAKFYFSEQTYDREIDAGISFFSQKVVR